MTSSSWDHFHHYGRAWPFGSTLEWKPLLCFNHEWWHTDLHVWCSVIICGCWGWGVRATSGRVGANWRKPPWFLCYTLSSFFLPFLPPSSLYLFLCFLNVQLWIGLLCLHFPHHNELMALKPWAKINPWLGYFHLVFSYSNTKPWPVCPFLYNTIKSGILGQIVTAAVHSVTPSLPARHLACHPWPPSKLPTMSSPAYLHGAHNVTSSLTARHLACHPQATCRLPTQSLPWGCSAFLLNTLLYQTEKNISMGDRYRLQYQAK